MLRICDFMFTEKYIHKTNSIFHCTLALIENNCCKIIIGWLVYYA